MSDAERNYFLEVEERVNEKRESYLALKNIVYSDESLDMMNSTIIDNINNVVGEEDTLIIAGDLFFGDMSTFIPLRSRIRCRHIQITWGNHDKRLRSNYEMLSKIYEGIYGYPMFERAEDELEIDQQFYVSHRAPIHYEKGSCPDPQVARDWAAFHKEGHYIHGHSHGTLQKWFEKVVPDVRIIDVGVDFRAQLGKGYTPWSVTELVEYLEARRE